MEVTFIERKPVKGVHFSIEKVFDNIIANLPDDITVKRVQVPCNGVGIFSIIRNVMFVRSLKSQIFHVTGDIHYALLGVNNESKKVITVHDIDSGNKLNGVKRLVFYFLWLRWPLNCADAITVVSEHSKKVLTESCPVENSKITVIDNPISPSFHVSSNKKCDIPGDSVKALFIGSAKNKNLKRVVEAIKGLPITLRIIGIVNEQIMHSLKVNSIDFTVSSSISEDQLVNEYHTADVLVFPSLSEGFGLPIVEAQASGTLVLTSDRSPMNTVAGGAAILVDPESTHSIRNGLTLILNGDVDASEMIMKGIKNSNQFRSNSVAERYATVYHNLVC